MKLADASVRQARNSATYWSTSGLVRGHEIVRRRAYVAVIGDHRAGTRVLIQEPDLEPTEIAEITDLARSAAGPVDLEDPFSAADLSHLGLRSWQMPVMFRPAGPAAAPALDVVRVKAAEDLAAAEQVIIAGFGLTRFEPHRAGEMLPPALIEQPGTDVFLARIDGLPAGACVTVAADGIASYYWVGTPEEFRSRGVGRAVMLASLDHLQDLPTTLTASRLGRPLYESLGWRVASDSTWYSST